MVWCLWREVEIIAVRDVNMEGRGIGNPLNIEKYENHLQACDPCGEGGESPQYFSNVRSHKKT